jgi:hypothetical protein
MVMDMTGTKYFCTRKILTDFSTALNETVQHVKENLMPEYDYDEFTRRQEEWEKEQAMNNEKGEDINSEDDMGW